MPNNEDISQLDQLLHETGMTKSYTAQIPLYLQALNIAERHNDFEKTFYIKLQLVEAYTFTGESKKCFAELMWLFNNVTDEILNSPTRIQGYTLRYLFLFEAKYIQSLHYFTNIPLQKITEMHEHVKKLYLRCNEGLRPVYCTQLKAAVTGTELMDPDECYNNWISSSKTQYDDCRACEKHLEVEYFIYKSDYKSALMKTEDLLKAKESCHYVPLATFSNMLSPLVNMGRVRLADSYHKRSYPKIARDKGFINDIAYHIIYMCLRDYEKAMSMLIENLSVFQAAQDDYDSMHYYICAFALFHTLDKNGKEDVNIRLDKSSEIYNESGVYNVKMLKNYYKDKMDLVINEFDKRNCNNVVSRLIDEKLSILEL